MTLEENNEMTEHQLETDVTGLAEIQHALDEINKLEKEGTESEVIPEKEGDETEVIPEEEIKTSDEKIKVKKDEKVWKLKRDKYKALAEKEEALKELSEVRQMLNESLNSGTYHYGKSAYSDLDRAKQSKRSAIENGDIEALLEADEALTRALQTVSEMEKWAQQDKRKAAEIPVAPASTEQSFSEMHQEIAADWLESHPYLQPTSKQYNSELAQQVGEFIQHLDKDLRRKGKMNEYFTERYFDTIEDYMYELNQGPKENSSPKNKEIESHVGSVRNTHSAGGTKPNSSTQITLSADEKTMAYNAALSEKEWIASKLKFLKLGNKK